MTNETTKTFHSTKYGDLYVIPDERNPLFCSAQMTEMLGCEVDENVSSYLRSKCKKYDIQVEDDLKEFYFLTMKDIEWMVNLCNTQRARNVKKWIKEIPV